MSRIKRLMEKFCQKYCRDFDYIKLKRFYTGGDDEKTPATTNEGGEQRGEDRYQHLRLKHRHTQVDDKDKDNYKEKYKDRNKDEPAHSGDVDDTVEMISIVL